MGAGLSGISCAFILEQNGIQADIFEARSEVGDRFVNCEILLPVLNRPIKDPIKFFSEKYDLTLKPQNNIKQLILHSENKQTAIKGTLGFTNLRGRTKTSFDKQLARKLDSKIHFNSQKTYQQLLSEYTHVVMATGDAAQARKIQNYQLGLTVTLKGALIHGNFEPRTVEAWLDNNIAPRGYGYLIPLSSDRANIVIGFPDQEKIHDPELLWLKFKQEMADYLQQEIEPVSHFEVNNYQIGLCEQPRIGNTYFVGNNFGTIMPFLGFGQVEAILTGIYAGLDICNQGNYEKLVQPLRKSYHDSLTLRRRLEKMDNHQYDRLIQFLDSTTGQKLAEKLFNSKHSYLKYLSKILKPFTRVETF